VSESGPKIKSTLGRIWGSKSTSDGDPGMEEIESPARQGWLGRLKAGLGKTSTRLSDGITGLFTKSTLSEDTLEDLENVLIEADLGLDTAERIIETLGKGRYEKGIQADNG